MQRRWKVLLSAQLLLNDYTGFGEVHPDERKQGFCAMHSPLQKGNESL